MEKEIKVKIENNAFGKTMMSIFAVLLVIFTFMIIGVRVMVNKYDTIELADTDILFIYLKYELPEIGTNQIIYDDDSGHDKVEKVKYNEHFLVVEHKTDGTTYYSMNEIIVWGIDK